MGVTNVSNSNTLQAIEGGFQCSCLLHIQPRCSSCPPICLKHHVFHDQGGWLQIKEIGVTGSFATSDCQFCYVIKVAFLRSLGFQFENDQTYLTRGGFQYRLREAQFSSTASSNRRVRTRLSDPPSWSAYKYLQASFCGSDPRATAQLGPAVFLIGQSQTTRPSWLHEKLTGFRKSNHASVSNEVKPLVDWNVIRKWIGDCLDNHRDCGSTIGPVPLEHPARVIDVKLQCLVQTPQLCEYVALSYVWGDSESSTPMHTATTRNISFLHTPGALGGTSMPSLPRTVVDAMYACAKMGYRYIWIDALCIIQDLEIDVTDQISRMGDIYSGAILTIVAAWGGNANSGLPGTFTGPHRTPQYIAKSKAFDMVEVLPFHEIVMRQSIWQTRAWTQQEWLLSTRCLYFTQVQVYYECKAVLHNEDAWASTFKRNTRPNVFKSQLSEPWVPFRKLLEDFTRRDITFGHDIFNACTGSYRYIYGKKSKRFIFGLPEDDFCDALRWYSPGQKRRSYNFVYRFIIPSWSWAFFTSFKQWYKGNGPLFYQDSEDCPKTEPLVEFQVCVHDTEGWTTVESLAKGDGAGFVSQTLKPYPRPILEHKAHHGRLRLRTQTVKTRYRDRDALHFQPLYCGGCRFHQKGIINYDYMTNHDIDIEWSQRHNPDSGGMQDKNVIVWDFSVKFIAISAIYLPPHWTIAYLEQYLTRDDPHIAREVNAFLQSTIGTRPILHVMLIEERRGVARRLGVGNVSLWEWLNSNPVMEDIVLL
ncbi:heterokaryon incompatibility protein-domain-containing protein [Lophiotrema nucula]|uniref:Heterokaryon incompatibility protein-domain-containing protein n=1 Tax=Lophiotrema nucula TaxID=690887 RepID=A0A6A5YWQ2_9PLEO|nr:heterokaryon incompatibility protein-domain-containing protein [Lophiotrema nucula]